MLIRDDAAEYVLAVVQALRNGELLARELSVVCPECGQPQTSLDNDNHLVVPVDEHHMADGVAVVIGCEGFWAIDPATVGVNKPNWQGWLTWERFGPEEPDDFTARSRHRAEGATHAFYAMGPYASGDGWGLDLIQMRDDEELHVMSWPPRDSEEHAVGTAAAFERLYNPNLHEVEEHHDV